MEGEERSKPSISKQRLKNMTKEQLHEALQKKKEGNTRALHIVESFTENNQTEEEFLSKLFDLNQSHYQDIVEERSILKKCGYTLCNKTLGQIPNKQYHISTLHNRVFDITERKNFCSNNCFKSSNYIKDQMLTSPLWMRDTEKIPDFKLLSMVASGKDMTGNEINLGHNRVKQNGIETPYSNKDVTTIQEALADIDEAISLAKSNLGKTEWVEKDTDRKNAEETNKTNDERDYEYTHIEENTDSTSRNKAKESSNTKDICGERGDGKASFTGVYNEISTNKKNHSFPIITDKSEKKSRDKCDRKNDLLKEIIEVQPLMNLGVPKTEEYAKKNLDKSKEHSPHSNEKTKPTKSANRKDKESSNKARNKVLALESNLKQWISVETLVLLLGDAVVQNALVETNKHYKQHTALIQRLETTSESHMSDILGKHKASYNRYSALCRKLNMLELVDELEDSRLKGSKDPEVKGSRPGAPVPQFEELRRQTEEMMIVVNDFYKGDKRRVTFAETTPEADEEDDSDTLPIIIPPVDLHAQNALRRKILLDKLTRIFPEILRLLGAPHLNLSITSDLRSLVRTFKLTAHNVMAHSEESSLVSVVLLKMLAAKDEHLKRILATEQSCKHLTLICLSYGLDLGYLDRLLLWLLDPHHVIASTLSSSK